MLIGESINTQLSGAEWWSDFVTRKIKKVSMTNTKSILNQIFDTKIPDLLYHYTTSSGLLGIIESNNIWLSKIIYMNDTSEVQLAIDFIKNEIALQMRGTGKTRTEKELDIMSKAIEHIETVNVSVASFTENGDQLSQWRGYGNVGNGYSLGFNATNLRKKILANNGFHLLPCIYDNEEQKQLAKEIVDRHPSKDSLESAREQDKNIGLGNEYQFLSAFSDSVLSFAPLIKSRTFQEEKEWRLISPPLSYQNVKFRQGNHSLIPYWEFDLNLENTLKEIIIGPTPEPKLSSLAVRGLLIKKDLIQHHREVNISQSKIPFRRV